jgi:phosphatidylglycerophosphatase A
MPQASLAARSLATWFGCGRAPLGPGTVGALGTLPLHWALRALGPVPYAAGTLALTVAGVWASNRVAEALEDEDPSSVVIDEVVGTLLALGIGGASSWRGDLLGFALFRLLDIVKPGIIDDAQRLRPPGMGIMADDVLAGIGAGLAVRIARLF